MLWTLQKYIFREMGKAFLLTAAGLMVVLGLGGGVINMVKLDGISTFQLLQIMALVFPVAGILTLPIAALFSATVTYGRLSADNELVACRSGGINIHELFLPTMVISLVSATLSFLFINFLIPGMFQRIDQFVAADLPRIIKAELSSPERLSLSRNKFTLFAETANIETPDSESTDQNVKLRLSGVAFVMMDDDNWTRLGTARNVEVGFDSEDGFPVITGDMYDMSLYDMEDGRYIDSGHESLGRFSLRKNLPLKVKWLTLGELLTYQNDTASFPDIGKRIEKLQSNISLVLMFRDIREQYLDEDTPGEVTLIDGDLTYKIKSEELLLDKQNGRPIFDGAATVQEFIGGERKRTITADNVAMLVDRSEDKKRAGVFLQANGNVEIQDPLAPNGIVRDDRRNLSAVSVSDRVLERARDYTDAKLLNTETESLGLGQEIDKKREELLGEVDQLTRDITSVIHSRMAFSLSVFALVILGAALGIIFKGSQVLVAFGISFVPSLFVIVMIISGKQLIENSGNPGTGLFMIWAGIGLVVLIDVFVMLRVVRR